MKFVRIRGIKNFIFHLSLLIFHSKKVGPPTRQPSIYATIKHLRISYASRSMLTLSLKVSFGFTYSGTFFVTKPALVITAT